MNHYSIVKRSLTACAILFLPILLCLNQATAQTIDYQATALDSNMHNVKIMLSEISAYTASKDETDDDPNTMANGEKPYLGAIACPRHLPFETKVIIEDKTYTCADRMNKRYTNHFDILMETKKEAFQFGRKTLQVIVIL